MKITARRILFIVVAAVPFALVSTVSVWSIRPLGQMAARWCNLLVAALPVAADAPRATSAAELASPEPNTLPADEPTPLPDETHAPPSGPRSRFERRGANVSSMATRRVTTARRARPYVFVGPDSVKRAIPMTGRPSSSWIDPTAEHPAGLLIQSPGALAGIIEPGDILVEAEGQALHSFDQLVVTVKQAYERGVKRLSGRLFRRGDLVPVTVEPGW